MTPFLTADVVILVPFRKFFEFRTMPVMLPSGFCWNLEMVGTPGAAFFFGAAFFAAAGFVTLFFFVAPPPNRLNVGDRFAGVLGADFRLIVGDFLPGAAAPFAFGRGEDLKRLIVGDRLAGAALGATGFAFGRGED